MHVCTLVCHLVTKHYLKEWFTKKWSLFDFPSASILCVCVGINRLTIMGNGVRFKVANKGVNHETISMISSCFAGKMPQVESHVSCSLYFSLCVCVCVLLSSFLYSLLSSSLFLCCGHLSLPFTVSCPDLAL